MCKSLRVCVCVYMFVDDLVQNTFWYYIFIFDCVSFQIEFAMPLPFIDIPMKLKLPQLGNGYFGINFLNSVQSFLKTAQIHLAIDSWI